MNYQSIDKEKLEEMKQDANLEMKSIEFSSAKSITFIHHLFQTNCELSSLLDCHLQFGGNCICVACQLKKLLLSKDNAWEASLFVGCTRTSKKDNQPSQRLVHVALLFPFEVENEKGVLLLDAGLRFCEVVQLSNLTPNNSTTTNKQKFKVFLEENNLIVESSSFVYNFTLKPLCFQELIQITLGDIYWNKRALIFLEPTDFEYTKFISISVTGNEVELKVLFLGSIFIFTLENFASASNYMDFSVQILTEIVSFTFHERKAIFKVSSLKINK